MIRARFWLPPAATGLATVLLFVAAAHDAFVFALLLTPILLLMALAAGVWALLARRSRTWPAAIATAGCALTAMAFIPLLLFFGFPARDAARFTAWAVVHRQKLEAASARPGVIQHWEGWGFATLNNDTYLVSDPVETLSGAVVRPEVRVMPKPQDNVAQSWAKAQQLTCGIARVQRMKQGIYLINTGDCVL